MNKATKESQRFFMFKIPQTPPFADGSSLMPSVPDKGKGLGFIFYIAIFLFIPIFFIILFLSTAQASEHFRDNEFACHCCGQVKVDPRLTAMLERLRSELADDKIIITSGYRCPRHNKKIGGVKKSQHLLGKAADIKAAHHSPAEVGHFAKMLGFGYVQTYRSWTHVDVR